MSWLLVVSLLALFLLGALLCCALNARDRGRDEER